MEDGPAFSGQVRSLQQRLAEVRAQRQALGTSAASESPEVYPGMSVPQLPELGSSGSRGLPKPRAWEFIQDPAPRARPPTSPTSSLDRLEGPPGSTRRTKEATSTSLEEVLQPSAMPGPTLPIPDSRRRERESVALLQGQGMVGSSISSPGAAVPEGGSTEHRPGSPEAPGLSAGESAGSDVHLLRSENHFLTEKLVEASLQSAQHFEALSSNRDELRRQVQDLRTQLDSEKAQRSRFEERLASAEEILGRLTEENMRLSGNAKAPEATSPASQPEQMDRDSLWKVYTSLREKAERLGQENEELRKLTEQRTSEANSTIMELAQRNLQLEGRLQAAQQQLEKLRGVTPNLPGSCSTTPRAASQSSRSVSRSGSAVQVRQRVDLDIERNASAQSLHSAASDRRSTSQPRRSPSREGRAANVQASLRARAAGAKNTAPQNGQRPKTSTSARPTPEDLQSSLNRLAEEMRRFQEKVVQYNTD